MLQWREFLSRSGVEETEGIGKCVSRSANCDYDYDSTDAVVKSDNIILLGCCTAN